MNKIIFVLAFLSSSFAFSQSFPIDFSDPADTTNCAFCFTLTTDAGDDVGQVIGDGSNFDTAQINLTENLDLSDDANNTITFRIKPVADYGVRTHLLKFEGGTGPNTELAFTTTGTTWQNISLDFPAGLGNYNLLVFFPDFNNADVGTYLVDDFAGGTNITPVPDPMPAPLPNSPDSETYSIYNDNSGFTTTFPFAYSFGTLGAEPDLDTGVGTNLALKLDLSFAGYGQGEGGPDDISAYNYVNFMYWAVAGVPGFQFRMISNDGVVSEYTYEIGTQEPIVTGAWTQVSIPMTYFTSLGFPSTNFFQWKFEAFMQVVTDPGTVYIDNIILTQNLLSVDDFALTQFKIFPNPSSSIWNIEATKTVKEVKVFDILGKEVMVLNPNSSEFVIDANKLNSGIYLARISTGSRLKTIKLVKD